MIKKDFNFFEVYKNGPTKGANSVSKVLILTVLSFIFIVAVSYGLIFIFKMNKQTMIDDIKEELSRSSTVEIQNKLNDQISLNANLKVYSNTLKISQSTFNKSRIIDSLLFDKIATSTPEDFTIKNITINPQNITITGQFTEALSTATFKQALMKLGIFDTITYNSMVWNDEKEVYIVTLYCTFKEVTP